MQCRKMTQGVQEAKAALWCAMMAAARSEAARLPKAAKREHQRRRRAGEAKQAANWAAREPTRFKLPRESSAMEAAAGDQRGAERARPVAVEEAAAR